MIVIILQFVLNAFGKCPSCCCIIIVKTDHLILYCNEIHDFYSALLQGALPGENDILQKGNAVFNG